jgi:uncharacterized membrane protein
MPSTENIPEFGKMITLSIVITVIAILYFILVTCPVLTGLMYAYMKAARNEPPEIEDMFKVFRNYWHVVLEVILTNLICLIGLILLIFPE